MNYSEAEMKELGTKEQQLSKLKEMALIAEHTNKSKCKHCYGNGSEGFSVKLNQYIVCRCIQKALKKIILQKKAEENKN